MALRMDFGSRSDLGYGPLEPYNGLIENAKITGDFLLEGLKQLEVIHGDKMGRSRGVGTFCAFSANNTKTRDAIVKSLQQAGVEAGGCGAYTIRFRPSMVFMPQHAAVFLEILDQGPPVCHETSFILTCY